MDLKEELESFANQSKETEKKEQYHIEMIVKVNNMRKALQKQEEINASMERQIRELSKELASSKIKLLTEKGIVDNLKQKVVQQQLKMGKMEKELLEKCEKFCDCMTKYLQVEEARCNENSCVKAATGADVKNKDKHERLMYLKGEIQALELFVSYQRNKIIEAKEFLDRQ